MPVNSVHSTHSSLYAWLLKNELMNFIQVLAEKPAKTGMKKTVFV